MICKHLKDNNKVGNRWHGICKNRLCQKIVLFSSTTRRREESELYPGSGSIQGFFKEKCFLMQMIPKQEGPQVW